MRILKVKQHLTDEELLKKRKFQKEVRIFLNWQIVYLVQVNSGKKAEDYAVYLGIIKAN